MDSDSDYNPLTFEKKVNRSKSKQKRVRFTPETKTRMIRLYERHPCLWDTKHLDYWNRIERSKAERAIASELNYPEALVNSKWQILRNEFRTERNRVLKSRETKKVYESKWPFYQHMQFLNNHSNRPYKLGKRQFSSAGVGDSVAVKLDLDEELNDDGGDTPISIDSKLSMVDNRHAPVAVADTCKPMYSNVCTYVSESTQRSACAGNVSYCLEIIDELSKKISPIEQRDEVRVFVDYVATQLKQIKTKSCRRKCVHEIQRAVMEWQNKDDEFVNQLQPQQEWQILEETDSAANKTAPDVHDSVADPEDANTPDPLDGELASMGFDV